MKHLNKYNMVITESFDNYEMMNEEFLNNMVDKVVNWYKENISKSEVKKGQSTDTAKRFNASDFSKFMKKILPSYTNLEERDQKKDLLKKIDGYMMKTLGVVGLATLLYWGSPDFRELIETFKVGAGISMMGIAYLGMIFNSIHKAFPGTTDVSIKIEHKANPNNLVNINFDFYHAVSVKTSYRILYNSFVRLLTKYENEEWADIEWGKDSPFKGSKDPNYNKPSKRSQHLITLNFYPREFINLLYDTALEIYEDRKEYADNHNIKYTDKIKNNIETRGINFNVDSLSNNKNNRNKRIGDITFDERKNMVNVEYYIQQMSNQQLLDLSKKIDNLELKYHEPIKYISIEELRKK